ncbi:hypothetical protein HBI56_001060 [Parastagonospora nodorum]|uniref:Uncharacterized protein n=1 Tax=Phaeosphaeria nodorum (strain SN15 / ATCC MYA-4574 / FGSC 10173) TaxID=321614 RepID=A0A7U2ER33_PHANO|nr:hypothetical protein HBH56_140020 [Parastagonospora nodorum]QRC91523.1 hypothetical protein JI435_426970 [Parastagonospora nodorum SN15]KAH3928112.1 hypothetical protein HBH54_145160 [Parastagonospora nodorum]KAH3948973.1 hypothetical protein HBH53_095160 [Parastagonospora nodorum]KAH3972449.1 hypothetical protein HBH52_150090 [Parastagonospora nodorum]
MFDTCRQQTQAPAVLHKLIQERVHDNDLTAMRPHYRGYFIPHCELNKMLKERDQVRDAVEATATSNHGSPGRLHLIATGLSCWIEVECSAKTKLARNEGLLRP